MYGNPNGYLIDKLEIFFYDDEKREVGIEILAKRKLGREKNTYNEKRESEI